MPASLRWFKFFFHNWWHQFL